MLRIPELDTAVWVGSSEGRVRQRKKVISLRLLAVNIVTTNRSHLFSICALTLGILCPSFNSLVLQKKKYIEIINFINFPGEGQISWVQHETLKERLRDQDFFSLKSRKLGGYLAAVFSYLMEELKDTQILPRHVQEKKEEAGIQSCSKGNIS